jgi:NAD(P)-dependent dehydrogenase (short-subunit alcohol dehydrogenase family)
MTKTLITGANKGLGYEAAKRLVVEGRDVWIGARDTRLGEEATRDPRCAFRSARQEETDHSLGSTCPDPRSVTLASFAFDACGPCYASVPSANTHIGYPFRSTSRCIVH